MLLSLREDAHKLTLGDSLFTPLIGGFTNGCFPRTEITLTSEQFTPLLGKLFNSSSVLKKGQWTYPANYRSVVDFMYCVCANDFAASMCYAYYNRTMPDLATIAIAKPLQKYLFNCDMVMTVLLLNKCKDELDQGYVTTFALMYSKMKTNTTFQMEWPFAKEKY